MKRVATLQCILGLLCLYSWAPGQVAELQPGVLVFCDNPVVARAVSHALSQFNKKVVTGHKFALYQILSASKSENGLGSVYSVKFSSRKSDCPAGDSKVWSECGYLADGVKEPRSCNATVYVTETETETTQVDCQIADPVIPERAQCLGCPQKVKENSEELKVPLSVSISKFNAISNSTHLFMMHSVGDATREVMAGLRYSLTFNMSKSNCSKAEYKQLHEFCVHNADDMEFVNCNSTVDLAPWRHEAPDAEVQCRPVSLITVFRRRPPGWSPLRNVDEQVAPSVFPVSPSSVLPTSAAPAKEESSSEEVTSKASPADDTSDPFRCPSKPWRAFSLAPPTPTASYLPLTHPDAEEGFSNMDLIG